MRGRVTDAVIYCCKTNFPRINQLQTTNIYTLVSFYRLGIWIFLSCVAIKMSAEVSHFSGAEMNLCPGWLTHLTMGRKLHIPQHMDLSVRLWECPYNMADVFLKDKLDGRAGKLEPVMSFFEPVSKGIHCHFCPILLIRNKSLSPAQPDSRGWELGTVFEKSRIEELWMYYWTTTSDFQDSSLCSDTACN